MAIVSFYKLVAGNSKYIIPLTGVVAFGWQLDPTLGMVGLAVVMGLLVFRIKLIIKNNAITLCRDQENKKTLYG